MSNDEEKEIGDIPRPDGHPSLAEFISSHRDHSTTIYRHYEDLAARDLLYLQSELAELKALQDAYDRDDYRPGQVTAKERARDWAMLKRLAAEPGNVKENARLELMLKIRKTLREYSTSRSNFLKSSRSRQTFG